MIATLKTCKRFESPLLGLVTPAEMCLKNKRGMKVTNGAIRHRTRCKAVVRLPTASGGTLTANKNREMKNTRNGNSLVSYRQEVTTPATKMLIGDEYEFKMICNFPDLIE
jgi:hypothetical protein